MMSLGIYEITFINFYGDRFTKEYSAETIIKAIETFLILEKVSLQNIVKAERKPF